MPAESSHQISTRLLVAIGLAGAAGFVDAFVYQNVMPVFVANMSGNLVRFGMSVGEGDVHGAVSVLIAIAAFSLAVVATATAIDRRVVDGSPPDPLSLLLVEVGLLAVVAVVAVAGRVEFSTELRWAHVTIVALGSAAMGLQATALRTVGTVAVSTTYGTGAIVRLGEKAAMARRRAPRPHGVPRRWSMVVLGAVLVAYVIGAISAAALPSERWLLAVVPIVTLVLAGRAHTLRTMRSRRTSIRRPRRTRRRRRRS